MAKEENRGRGQGVAGHRLLNMPAREGHRRNEGMGACDKERKRTTSISPRQKESKNALGSVSGWVS